MCLLRYRRMPADEYQLRYNDPGGEVLPLLWLGGSVLCLWFAVGAAAVVAVLEWDLLLGLGVGLGGAVMGILATTFLAVAFPKLDAHYLRLGPVAATIEFLTLFVGAIVVVLLGLWVLGIASAEVAAPEAAPTAAGQLLSEPGPATEGDGLMDAIRSLVRALSIVGLLAVASGFVVRLFRAR